MAQYFNVVTNASGTFTFEEVPRLCTVTGQRVQLVVEDVNNSGNGSQQLVTYTAASQNRQAIFSPQTINLGNQIAATRLEQGQNVFIIKTNDVTTTQAILKSNPVNAHLVNENIVNITDNTGTKAECKNEGQQVQWVKMQNVATTTKQTLQEKNLTAVITKSNIQNNIATSPPLYINSGQTDKKLAKSHQNKSQQLSNNVQVGTATQNPDGVNARISTENRIQNSTGNPKSVMPACNKAVNSSGQTVRPIRASNPNTSHLRPVAIVPPEISKTPTRVQPPDMEHLNEHIKQAKFKQMQSQQRQHTEKLRFQQNNAQRQNPNATVQHPIQCPSNNSTRRLTTANSVQQRTQQVLISSQKQQVQQQSSMISITFSGKTTVSLVDDPTLGINYIVEEGVGSVTSFDGSDHSDDHNNSIQEVVTSTTIENLSQNTNASDENSNASLSTEEPILVKGMFAVCPHCGYSSLHFNRCERCNTKLSEEVKSIPIAKRKETGMSVDMFYKKNNERNATKMEKMEQDGPTSKRLKAKSRARPKLIHKEPECLTISSDEEEENRTKKIESVNNNAPLNNASNTFIEDMDTILEKEPVITSTSVFNSYKDYVANNEQSSTGICDNQSLLDNEQLQQIAIECRTVRIGSYKYIPRENVMISHTGVRFNVPLLEDATSFVTLDVKYKDIVKLLIHFGKTMPVLFFYTSSSSGAMIRELLGMQDPKGPYYDPTGKDHTHRRITLLSDKLPDDSKPKLTSLFARGNKIDELNPKEANDILVRASPRDNRQPQNIVVTRKQNQSSVPNTVGVNDNIQTITVYPPPPAKGGIAINTEDYLCLAEDQFLNDVIIDFYLKYLTLEILSESDQHRTHVFSSYFYKRLTSPHAQAAESVVPMTPAAKRHARVQKWTKNVNIFEKDFIIIPINEHAHWFLAIICFPGLVGKISTPAKKTIENDVQKIVKKSKKLKELKTKAVTIGSTTITPVPTTITIDQPDDGSERDEAEGDDDEMEMDSDEEDETEQPEENTIQTQVKLEQQKEIVKIPCILIFDSLAGASRARVVATLRDYLSCEYVAKLGAEKTFSKDTIKGACPKVPQQSNFTDCGLYVLQYVESFFKDPIKDYTLPIKTLKMWFEEIIVTRKREELSKLLIRLMNNTKGDKTISLPTVNFPTQDGKLKPKSETQTDAKAAKPEGENKRKSTNVEAETRIVSIVAENTESSNEFISNRTYQIIPCLSSNSTESNTTEMNLTEQKTTRSSSETMSYLKAKRIPRLVSRTQNQDDSPTTKKHKGESFNSCK
ncbi:sentrin-specific protease 7-like isoform X6 [Nylanderia fulva]|uniref:sentrin-specific protease 7-like isoform X6 n=1 Tax=Nylanderia fulva TaxID=613905 RepID=UPI0010FBBAF6|nr:sentrin-specific protease 7-like isoform X6 [Nylanderia fulva]